MKAPNSRALAFPSSHTFQVLEQDSVVSSLGPDSAGLMESCIVSVTDVHGPSVVVGREEQFSNQGAWSQSCPQRYFLQVENDLLLIRSTFLAPWLSSSYLVCSSFSTILHYTLEGWNLDEKGNKARQDSNFSSQIICRIASADTCRLPRMFFLHPCAWPSRWRRDTQVLFVAWRSAKAPLPPQEWPCSTQLTDGRHQRERL